MILIQYMVFQNIPITYPYTVFLSNLKIHQYIINLIYSKMYQQPQSYGINAKQPKDDAKISLEEMKLPTISNCFALTILIIGTLLLCLIIILNVIIDTPLFIEGINFIYAYQHIQNYGWIHVIQNIFSLFCQPFFVGIVLIVYYIIVNRKLLLIVHLSYFLFATYIIALLKQSFQQSRPIWYESKINNWEWFCPKDFGNPSGHSFAVILLYEPIISDSIGYGGRFRPMAFILLIGMVVVPLSRMYLGVHSANQIFFGLSMGSVFLILYKYIYQKALYELYWQFLLGQKRKIKFVGVAILNLITIAIPIIFYQINYEQRPMLKKDIDNLNHQCKTNLTGPQVQAKMLDACAIGCFAFGLIYGFILLSNKSGYRKYLLGLWSYENYLKIILKIGIYIFSAGVPFLFFWLISFFATRNSPIAHYIMYCLAITGAGLGLSYLAPVITSKCKIMKLLPGQAEDYQNQLHRIHN